MSIPHRERGHSHYISLSVALVNLWTLIIWKGRKDQRGRMKNKKNDNGALICKFFKLMFKRRRASVYSLLRPLGPLPSHLPSPFVHRPSYFALGFCITFCGWSVLAHAHLKYHLSIIDSQWWGAEHEYGMKGHTYKGYGAKALRCVRLWDFRKL